MPTLDIAEFLRGEDIAPEANVRIANEGKEGEIPMGEGKEPKKSFEIGVILQSGEKKTWTVNMTSQRALASKWGKDTSKWVNQTATLFTQDVNVRGTPRKVIYARVPT